MSKLDLVSDPEVMAVFNSYPLDVQSKLSVMRNLIIEAAQDAPEITQLEETLKWGEPSYIAKKGSTLRIDWKKKTPDQYAMYFKCTSKLVPTFKTVFKNEFKYENTRAIVFAMDDHIPEVALKKCITAALTYHSIKKLPLLGL